MGNRSKRPVIIIDPTLSEEKTGTTELSPTVRQAGRPRFAGAVTQQTLRGFTLNQVHWNFPGL